MLASTPRAQRNLYLKQDQPDFLGPKTLARKAEQETNDTSDEKPRHHYDKTGEHLGTSSLTSAVTVRTETAAN